MPIHTQLLLVQQSKEHGFTPFIEDDMPGSSQRHKRFNTLFLNYQWPMSSIGLGAIPESTQKSIFPINEELFKKNSLSPISAELHEAYIEQIINQLFTVETSPKTYDYRVIFFPTALYELFVILETLTTQGQDNSLQDAIAKIFTASKGLWEGGNSAGKIELANIIDSNASAAMIRKKINATYMEVNTIFLNASNYINEKLTTWLFIEYPELKNSKNAADLSRSIYSKTSDITDTLIKKLRAVPANNLTLPREDRESDRRNNPSQLIKLLANESSSKIIASFITLEYEARELNKGILIRGTSFQDFQKNNNHKNMIAGSTVQLVETKEILGETMDEDVTIVKSFEQAYKNKETTPYSVSFGSYLFAGALRDRTACAYTFLNGERVMTSHSENFTKSVGYALLINKADYVEHQNSQLFFIPPLSSLASLFMRGEYFHPRSKAAIALKSNTNKVMGVHGTGISDPAGVILITRDPLKHAALFSEFLAENGRIIQLGEKGDLTPEEKAFVSNVMQTQKDAAKYYRGIKGMTPWWERTTEKLKTKRSQ